MRSKASIVALIAVVLAGFIQPALAARRPMNVLPALGGPGGEDRGAIMCDNGFFLVGVKGRVGAWLDQLAIVCAKWQAPIQTFAPVRNPDDFTPWFGTSHGGEMQTARCPGNSVVTALDLQATRRGDQPEYVQNFTIHCSKPRPPHAHVAIKELKSDDGQVPFYWKQQDCPPGQVAIGLAGRSGLYVDAVGLVCSTEPDPIGQVTVIHDPDFGAVRQHAAGGIGDAHANLPPPAPAPLPPSKDTSDVFRKHHRLH